MPRILQSGRGGRRCLIVERHDWETGGREQQLQFVLSTARQFFGPGNADRSIQVRLFIPPTASTAVVQHSITISHQYRNGTRRTNAFPEMGSVPSSFVFFEETGARGEYDVWWQEDKALVVARFRRANWTKGRNTQHGRGRLSTIVPASVVPRRIVDL